MMQEALIVSLARTPDIGHLDQILDGIFLMQVQHRAAIEVAGCAT